MVVYQRTLSHASPVATDVRETAVARSLPLNPQLCPDILPCYIYAKNMPQCHTYNAIGFGATSDITKTPIQDDFTLSVGRSLIRSREDKQHIPSWSAYNSVRGTPQKTLTTVAMMPLLAAPAHEYSTLLTVLKQAQKITTVVMGESRKTVITFDLQLYERAVKLQMHSAPALDHLVFMIGEMHTVLASLRAVGSFIEESGIDDAWMEADLYGSATTHQILEGRHMTRALNAHSITSSALSDMHLDAFLNSASECSQIDHSDILEAAIQENTACAKHRYDELDGHHKSLANAIETEELSEKLEKFDREMESRRPTFKFARDYMKFVAWIFLFIRATIEGNWNLHLSSLKELCKYFFAHDRLNYARMVPLYLVQMEKLQASDPDIYAEFLDGNFCVYKREVPFCAIGPDHAIEHVNKLMKISGGLKGLTQNASAMTRWFVMAHELGRLSSEAEDLAGFSRHKSTVHHDLYDASLERYERNVKQLKDVMKVNDPFMVAEGELVNIITNAVMPDEIMYAIMKQDSIGQDLFAKFVQERLVDRTLNVWSPMKKRKLQMWKTARKEQMGRSSANTTAMKDDRALFTRFIVVITSRPEIDLKESIGFEFAVYPRSLFTLDGNVRYCSGKSKLMEILENLPKGELADADKEHDETSVVIIDGMAVVQAMGKPSWVKTIQDLSNHFVQVVERRISGFKEVHVVFDRYDIQHSLKEGMRQGGRRSIRYSISNESVIEKVSLQQLLSNADNKQKLAMHLASHLIQCHEQSETIYVITYKDECKSNALSVDHLHSTHEEADTMMMLHAMDTTNRGAASICIQSPDTDVLVLALWCFPDLCDDTTLIVGTGNKRRVISVCQIHSALDEEQVSALPGLHALSGCDQTGTFCGKSKLSWWNSLRKCDDKMLSALCNLTQSYEMMTSTRSKDSYVSYMYLGQR